MSHTFSHQRLRKAATKIRLIINNKKIIMNYKLWRAPHGAILSFQQAFRLFFFIKPIIAFGY